MTERSTFEVVYREYGEILGTFLDFVVEAKLVPGTQEHALARHRCEELLGSLLAGHGWTYRQFMLEQERHVLAAIG